MQYGNRYSVHISSYGWCFDYGEFKTLEEANKCFYNKIRDEVEKQNPDHHRRFYVYMLKWSKDLSYHKEIRCWSIEEGYKIDFPKKPKSIFKILKQLYIKHKVEIRRRKEIMSKFNETIIDSDKGGVSVDDEMLNDMKTPKVSVDDLQKELKHNIMRRIMELRTKDMIEEDSILDVLDDNLNPYIDDLCKENKSLLESCEGATMMYNDLCKSKKIIKKLLALHFSPFVTQDEIIKQAQDFINQ